MFNFFVPTYYYLVIFTSAIEIKKTEKNVFVGNKPHNMCDEALLPDKSFITWKCKENQSEIKICEPRDCTHNLQRKVCECYLRRGPIVMYR